MVSADSIKSDQGRSSSKSGALERQRNADELSRLKETKGAWQLKAQCGHGLNTWWEKFLQ